MKKKICFLIFIILLSLTTSKSFSQNFKSIFGGNSTTWDVILHGYCDYIVSNTVVATTDTTVDLNNYKIISGLGGFLREDTIQGKVWFYNTFYHLEYLVMDLGLNLGDTFNFYDYNNVAIPYIVDSVYYVNSLKHIRLNAWTRMCALEEKITFIEGSGPTASFNYQRSPTNSVISYMLCHFKDGIKATGNELFNDTCFVFEVGIADNKSDLNLVKIFPNPASDIVTMNIDNANNSNLTLNIYTTMGVMVASEILKQNQQKINIMGLSNGIYMIEIKSKEWTENQKLIIQR